MSSCNAPPAGNHLQILFTRAQDQASKKKFTRPIIMGHIDLIAVSSARKAKSRAQFTSMRTTVAYTQTKHCFLLDYSLLHHTNH